MITISKLVASCFGIGYVRGGGTIAAALTAAVWYLTPLKTAGYTTGFIVAVIVVFAGTWVASKTEKDWGKDSSRVVIDEVAGMCVTLLFVPVKFWYVVAGLILFRFFDIVKPLLIRKTESLPGGWGVMADDVVAGIYSNLLLQLVLWFNLF